MKKKKKQQKVVIQVKLDSQNSSIKKSIGIHNAYKANFGISPSVKKHEKNPKHRLKGVPFIDRKDFKTRQKHVMKQKAVIV